MTDHLAGQLNQLYIEDHSFVSQYLQLWRWNRQFGGDCENVRDTLNPVIWEGKLYCQGTPKTLQFGKNLILSALRPITLEEYATLYTRTKPWWNRTSYEKCFDKCLNFNEVLFIMITVEEDLIRRHPERKEDILRMKERNLHEISVIWESTLTKRRWEYHFLPLNMTIEAYTDRCMQSIQSSDDIDKLKHIVCNGAKLMKRLPEKSAEIQRLWDHCVEYYKTKWGRYVEYYKTELGYGIRYYYKRESHEKAQRSGNQCDMGRNSDNP